MIMKRTRSKLPPLVFVLCGLSLTLFGCPSSNTGDNGGVENGGSGRDATNGGGTESGGGVDNDARSDDGPTGGGTNSLDRSPLVRPSSPTLFVADGSKGVASFANAHVLNGNVAPTTLLDASLRFIETFRDSNGETFDNMSPTGVFVDRVGSLIIQCRVSVADFSSDQRLRSYDNAATVTGVPAADREVSFGSDVRASDFGGIAYDRDNDRLFVAFNDRVLVFEGAALAQTGDAAPTRSFSNPDLVGASIALGPNGDLYVAVDDSFSEKSVLVFSKAGLRSGPAIPDRVIFLPDISSETVFVDSRDRLYVTDGFHAEIAVLDHASTLDGRIETFPVIVLQRLDRQGANDDFISGVVVDSRGIGYVALRDGGQIHIIDNIGTRSGDVRADRVIVPSAAGLTEASAIYLWE
jgi:hypothetical protein